MSSASSTGTTPKGGAVTSPREKFRNKAHSLAENVKPKEVPIQEMFALNPIQKFLKYRIFPFKLFVNITILTLLLVYIFFFHVRRNSYDANSRFGLASMFFDVADNTETSLIVEITSIDEFITAIDRITTAYYQVPDDSVGVYMHYVYTLQDPTPIAPILRLELQSDSFIKTGLASKDLMIFNLTMDHPMGPFGNVSEFLTDRQHSCDVVRDDRGSLYFPCRNSSVGEFFDLLTDVSVDLSIRGIRVDPSSSIASIVRWNIHFGFSLSAHHSIIKMVSQFDCIETQRPETLAVVVCCILIPMALWDVLLRMRGFHRYHIYVTTYLPHWLQNRMAAEDVDRDHERRFVSNTGKGWNSFAIFADCNILIFCMLSLFDSFLFFGIHVLRPYSTLFLGSSAMCSSFLLISYLQTAPRFYVLMKALGTALPHLGLYLVGVMPIFIGFAICGTAVFGGFTSTFSTLPNSMVTLFCVLNGDSLLQMFTTIDQTDFVPLRIFSRLFLVSFLGLFICNVLNIALSIVQDSYTHVKEVFEVCQFDQNRANKKLAGAAGADYSTSDPDGLTGSNPSTGGGGVTGSRTKPLRKRELRKMIERIQEALGPEDSILPSVED